MTNNSEVVQMVPVTICTTSELLTSYKWRIGRKKGQEGMFFFLSFLFDFVLLLPGT